MTYSILINKKSRKFITAQPRNKQRHLLEAIYKLPDVGDIKPIVGKKDMYRLRIGDYRVIYTLQRNILTVAIINAGNRGDVYDGL